MNISPLQQLLGPISQKNFLEDHWQKRSLVIRDRGDKWPFAFDRKAFYASLRDCYHIKAAYKDDTGQHKECDITHEQAEKLYDAGTTICATRVNYGNPGLQRYLDVLQENMLGSEFHMNSYLSPGGKGFGVHYDYHSVWVLQIEGSKRWFYAEEPAIKYPVMNCVFPLAREEFKFPWYSVARPNDADLREVVLEPGDLLYLPTGAWHKTEASGYSLSITMGHEPVQASKFITDIVTSGIWNDEASRRHVPFVPRAEDCKERAENELRATFDDALATLRERIDSLTADQLMEVWGAKVEAEQKQLQRKKQIRNASSASASPLLALFGQMNSSGNGQRGDGDGSKVTENLDVAPNASSTK